MRFSMVSLIGSMFLGCFATTATDTVTQTAFLDDQEIGCIPNNDQDFNLDIKLKAVRKGTHEFYIVFNNSLVESTPEFHNDGKFPTSFVYRDTMWMKVTIFAKGTKTLSITVDRKMINATGNKFWLYNRETNADGTKSATFVSYFRLDVQSPRTWDLTTEGDLKRDKDAFTGASVSDHTVYQNAYTIKHEGFVKEFKNPDKNRLPFNQLQIGVLDYKKELVMPLYRNAYIKITNYLSDFDIFPLETDGYTSWRQIPVEIVESDDNEMYTFQLRDTYAVTMDGRTMKRMEDKNDTDLYTNDLYFPPVEAGEAKVFKCILEVIDTGPNQLDKWVYQFEVTKTKNFIGSCISSTYCVGRE